MKILIALSRVPYPLEKGDKLRMFNHIKQLSKRHELVLFCINDQQLHADALRTLKQYCAEIRIVKLSKFQICFNLIRSLFNGLPFQVGYFYFNRAQKQFDELIASYRPDHIYCQLLRTTEYAKKYSSIPKTLDYMDVFSKGMERRLQTVPIYMKPFINMEYKRLLKYEHDVFFYFSNKTIISRQDRDFIPHPERSKIHVIPNGVDTDYFNPVESKKEFELLFNGNMNYPPNVESVEYLVNKVLPLVHAQLPNVKLLISGADPSARILALRSDKIAVSGWVDDIRNNFAKSGILVAPMQISIGLQNKLLEAMAMKLPCVTSTLANNALGAENGESILVADSPDQYASHIIDLLSNPSKAKQIAENAYTFVLKGFNWESTVLKLEELFRLHPALSEGEGSNAQAISVS